MYTCHIINLEKTPSICIIDEVSRYGAIYYLPYTGRITLEPGHQPWEEWVNYNTIYHTISVSNLDEIIPTIASKYPEYFL